MDVTQAIFDNSVKIGEEAIKCVGNPDKLCGFEIDEKLMERIIRSINRAVYKETLSETPSILKVVIRIRVSKEIHKVKYAAVTLLLNFCENKVPDREKLESDEEFCKAKSLQEQLSKEIKEMMKVEKNIASASGDCNEIGTIKEKMNEIYKFLSLKMIGQEAYIKTLSYIIARLVVTGKTESALLAIGETGSGKTYALELLSGDEKSPVKNDIDYIKINAELITSEGFKGMDPSDILNIVYKRININKNKNLRGNGKRIVVHIDEIDKIIANPVYDSHGESVTQTITGNILNIVTPNTVTIHGTSMPEAKTVNTGNLQFVLTGAFTKLYDLFKEDDNKVIGFGESEKAKAVNKVKKKLTLSKIRENLIKVGCTPEFAGRMNHIIVLDKLSDEDIKNIIAKKLEEEITQITTETGVKIDVSDSMINTIYSKASGSGFGARTAVNSISDIITCELKYDILESEYENVCLDMNENDEVVIQRKL